MKPYFWVAALSPVIVLACGCQTPPYCDPLAQCGGDFMAGATDIWKNDGIVDSEWIVTGPDSCMDQLQPPPNPVSLVQQPPRLAGERPIERGTADWCSNLAIRQDGTIRQYLGWYPPIPIRDGSLTFSADHTYSMQFVHFAPQHAEFSATCLTEQGVPINCPAFGRNLKEFVAVEANIYNVLCYDNPAGGCLCDYDLSFFGGPNGRWTANGSTITFFDDLFGPPSLADYCLKGDTLEMTGQNGTRLFNQFALRTLRFRRPTCEDGALSKTKHELGVDCGGDCPATCGSCTDGVMNGNEKGIDCGGSCPEVCGCFDKVQNPWEEGVDCGGPCINVCSCFDGVMNNNEDGVDCGGPCSIPCTCRNGVQDPNESGVDCGRVCRKDCQP